MTKKGKAPGLRPEGHRVLPLKFESNPDTLKTGFISMMKHWLTNTH